VSLGLILGLALVGCGSASQIRYAPGTPIAAAAKGNVGLRVADARPAANGGGTPNKVGQVRSGVGIPSDVEDRQQDVVPRTVTDATADALRKAGVGVQPGGKVLSASVKEYWMDGYMGYSANVVVDYMLTDAAGKSLWSAQVKGAAGGTSMFKSPASMTEDLFGRALGELAENASKQFNSAAFQQALSN
jgi:hypothetical protein